MMLRTPTTKNNRKHFTLIEVMFALIILAAMAVMFGVIMPVAGRNTRYAADYAQASSLVMHKINQIQEAGFDNMDAPGFTAAGITDTISLPTNNDTGAQQFTAEFTTIDNLAQFFNDKAGAPANSTDKPHGYIYIAPYSASLLAVPGTYSLIRATVMVQWKNSRGQVQSFSATTLVPKTTIE
jgi:type II secretory pathway pseudopilin PulG